MEIYLASETLKKEELTPQEHYSNRLDAAREYFGFPTEENNPNPNKEGCGVEHHLTSWFDDSTPRDKMLRPLDVIYVKNQTTDKSFWIPWIEYQLIKEVKIMGSNAINLQLGYVDGRRHHLQKFASEGMVSASYHPGYQIWIECQHEKELVKDYN